MKNFILILIFIIFSTGCSVKPKYEKVISGIIDSVEYRPGSCLATSLTIVHFKDGGEFVFTFIYSYPFKKGNRITILAAKEFSGVSWRIEETKEIE